MKKHLIKLIILITAFIYLFPLKSNAEEAGNNYPIILVHGFAGWGKDEMLGFDYWGRLYRLISYLEKQGHTVFVSDVGPFSSNWDRAIELYYQIKGGQTDYGKDHSEKFGHIQRPPEKNYTEPLYPEWDSDHPVHLVGHSMGGQTIRMLAAMLAGKSPEFKDILISTNGEPLSGGKGYIKSITTIASPHLGSSLFDSFIGLDKLFMISTLHADEILPSDIYTFDLEQWDIYQKDNETLIDYLIRIEESLKVNDDFSIYDLSTGGAVEFNSRVNFSTIDEDIYCFSYANSYSYISPFYFCHLPYLDMNPYFLAFSVILGLSIPPDGYSGTKLSWQENDGVINTASMIAPTIGCNDSYIPFNETPQKGTWNYMGKYYLDHTCILGDNMIFFYEINFLQNFYLNLAKLLNSL